jgi:hypothetical protein
MLPMPIPHGIGSGIGIGIGIGIDSLLRKIKLENFEKRVVDSDSLTPKTSDQTLQKKPLLSQNSLSLTKISNWNISRN